MQNAAKNLLFIYLRPVNDNVVFDDELAELTGFLLSSSAEVADVLSVFIKSLPRDDPKMEVRLQGLDRMRSGLSEMVAGTLTSIAERETYRTPARRRFTLHVRASVPRLARHLTDLQRQEIAGRLAALVHEESDAAIRELLSETLVELQ